MRSQKWKGLKQPLGRVQALLSQWFSHLSVYEDHQVTVKRQMVGPSHGVSDSVGLRQGPRLCVPNKFPGAATNCSMQCLLCSLLSSPVMCSSLPPKTHPPPPPPIFFGEHLQLLKHFSSCCLHTCVPLTSNQCS